MSLAKAFLLFLSFVVSVSALATPHVHRGVHHRALAGRVPVPIDAPAVPIRSRQNGKRCKPRPSSSVAAQPVQASSSQTPETTKAAPPPAQTTTKAAPAQTTSKAAPPPPATTKAAPPPPATTNKLAPVPETTTKPAPAPAPTTTKKPAPAPSPASNLPSFLVGTQTGQGTFYATGLGACGITNHDTDHIAAVSQLMFDVFPGYGGVNPNQNPICGRQINANYKGKSVTVTVTDRCTGCALTDLDFSPSAFDELADPALGRLSGVTWTWV